MSLQKGNGVAGVRFEFMGRRYRVEESLELDDYLALPELGTVKVVDLRQGCVTLQEWPDPPFVSQVAQLID